MAKLSIEERIAQLEARKRALKARLTKHDRVKDTRRKVLLGALVLQQMEGGCDAEFKQRLTSWLKGELPGFLTRDEDRKLFPEFIDPASGLDSSVEGSQTSTPASSDPATSPASNEEGREGNEGDGGDYGSHAN